jgi:hypothetical protein
MSLPLLLRITVKIPSSEPLKELVTRCSPVVAFAALLGCGVLAAACGSRSGGVPSTGPSPVPSSSPAPPTPSPPTPAPERPFAALDGSYQVTIVADGCQDSFPDAYRRRTYAAQVDQKGADVTFVLVGVPPVAGATESPRLWGVMGSEHLTLTNYEGNESWFPLYEQVEPTHLLVILIDEMRLTGSAERLSGAWAGSFLLYEGSVSSGWPVIVTSCESKNHVVTFTR